MRYMDGFVMKVRMISCYDCAMLISWHPFKESQAVAGRWRALTLRHLHQMTPLGTDWALKMQGLICNDLVDVMLSAKCKLNRSQISSELDKYAEKINIIINAALHLKRVLGEHVISSDLDVVNFKGGEIFDPSLMDASGGQGFSLSMQEKVAVLCTTELGLRREVKGFENGREIMDVKILLKPKVVLETDIVQSSSSDIVHGRL